MVADQRGVSALREHRHLSQRRRNVALARQGLWAFDYGDRLYWRRDGTFADRPPTGEPGWQDFLHYQRADEFASDIKLVAEVAKARVEQLRAMFPDPCATARLLATRPTSPGQDQSWRTYDAGAAAALCGDAVTAGEMLSRITAGAHDPDWIRERADRATRLAKLAVDPPRL